MRMIVRSVSRMPSLASVQMCIRDRLQPAGMQQLQQLVRRARQHRLAEERAHRSAHGLGAVSYTHLDVYKRQRAMLSALFCRFVRTTAAALSHSAAALSA